MADIINLLPDAIANQIAAGEVIQRPASIVKELVENAVDAGSNKIDVFIKDGGRTLVHTVDNGSGMSITDARMSFERHATSKINTADDLFAIRTKGFRGEALASIASVAEVEMKTKRVEDEMGTLIKISGSVLQAQEPVGSNNGTSIAVKNLFYNVPARRKFLKADSTELRHIINEVQRVALAHPDVGFTLYHNNNDIFQLPGSSLKQRIVHVFGKSISAHLTDINSETQMGKIYGFIGKPEFAKKKYGEQYFFVNNRFMKHPYFHRAIMAAFEQILAPEYIPSYFIYFEVPSNTIDVNIHPTKTEIKFEDEQAWWQLLKAAIREALGKFNIIPSIDFETGGIIDIPVGKPNEVFQPNVDINFNYNPFNNDKKETKPSSSSHSGYKTETKNSDFENWEKMYEDLKTETLTSDLNTQKDQQPLFETNNNPQNKLMQVRNKYILSPVKSGIMLIDQKRAHQRILYEQFLYAFQQNKSATQQNLFPEQMELTTEDYLLLEDIMSDLTVMGFDISGFGKNAIVINGCPAVLEGQEPKHLIQAFINEYRHTETDIKAGLHEKLATSLANASAIEYGKALGSQEMQELVDALFACKNPNHNPSGKVIVSIIGIDEIEKLFK